MTVLRTLMEMLREIFDEAAYARFLQQSGGEVSAKSYLEFLDRRHNGEAQPPHRCC